MEANAGDLKKQIQDNELKWYAISVVSGQEELVIQNMKERIQKQKLTEDVVDCVSPMISETSMRKGEKIVKYKKIYPGYIFIHSKMNDKIWYIVRNTPGVRLIVGADTRPIPVTDEEYDKIMQQIKKSEERSELTIPYKVGDLVILREGDFKSMQGVIRELDLEKGTVVVNIEMLGRQTPVVISADKIDLVS
ncbi:MAG: hypothetical protein CR971_01370 [candidate division SR1 bacterium]|nr:MAG: hypothetical protein CR971_01370 [candidate division SR1 bacterium]